MILDVVFGHGCESKHGGNTVPQRLAARVPLTPIDAAPPAQPPPPRPPPRADVASGSLLDEVTAHMASIQQCLRRSLARDAPTTGYRIKLELRMGITALEHIAISGRANGFPEPGLPPSLVECVTTAVRGWQLQLAPGTHEVAIDVNVE